MNKNNNLLIIKNSKINKIVISINSYTNVNSSYPKG